MLRVPRALAQAVREHARRTAPDECIGLLFGEARTGRVARAVPLSNHARAPRTTFFGAPQELFDALRGAEARSETLLAIYHSHPLGPAYPSPTDLAAAHYRALCLIVTPAALRVFSLERGEVAEVRLELDDT